VRRVQVLGTQIQWRIENRRQRSTRSQRNLTHPDACRDFANPFPGRSCAIKTLNRGEVKSVRRGLFTRKPPVTRIVFDLNGPQAYRFFPAGRTVIIKLGSAGAQAAHTGYLLAFRGKLVTSSYTVQSVRSRRRRSASAVGFISRRDAYHQLQQGQFVGSLVRNTSAHRTEIAIPPDRAGKVVAEIGPARAEFYRAC